MAWIPLQFPDKQRTSEPPKVVSIQEVRSQRISDRLTRIHSTFQRWLSSYYDVQLLDIVLSTAAGNLLKADPIWLMIVGASGSGKTETVSPLVGCGAHIVSSISSEGALLSASSKKDVTTESTGGLLTQIGEHGLLVIKDFTSILSMPDRGSRPQVLAALREVHDGKWVRNVGSDGGRTLTWEGHLGIIGCCTTTWDVAYGAIAAMGDRFIVVRLNTHDPSIRLELARQAISNIGSEKQMRQELTAAVGELLQNVTPNTVVKNPPDVVYSTLLRACNVAAMARTPTEHDYKGRVTYSHDAEAPTRLAKSLAQMIRGSLALEIPLADAFNLAMRCVRDSVPPIRLQCLEHMLDMREHTTTSLAHAIQKPWYAVDRALQALYSAGMLTSERRSVETAAIKQRAFYRLKAEDIGALYASAEPSQDMSQ